MNQDDQVIIYQANDGQAALEVSLQGETVWLTQKQMAILFDKNVMTINEHVRNVYKERELNKRPTIRNFLIVQKEGNRQVSRDIEHYSLDVIISIGYRVKSKRGTQFRIWANGVLKDHLIKGYTINEKRLKEKTGQLEDLKKVVQLQEKIISNYHLEGNQAEGLIKVIANYAQALDMLDDYDHQRLTLPKSRPSTF